jgi:hypothetical protein
MKKLTLFAGAAALALSSVTALPAMADTAAQLAVAQTHAGMAAKQTDITKVHMHLQHALNCLVGPAGSGFDAAPGNPCAKAGNGAIPESTSAAQKAKLEAAVVTAKAGVASSDLATAQSDAQKTADAVAAAK